MSTEQSGNPVAVDAQALQARGRMALRVLKLRQKAATYQAIAAELEVALVLSDQGDSASLEKWMQRYAESTHPNSQPTSSAVVYQRSDGAHPFFQGQGVGDIATGDSSVPIDRERSTTNRPHRVDPSPWTSMLAGAESRFQARSGDVTSERSESTLVARGQSKDAHQPEPGWGRFPLELSEVHVESTHHLEQAKCKVDSSREDEFSQPIEERFDLSFEGNDKSWLLNWDQPVQVELFKRSSSPTPDPSAIFNRRVALPSWLVSLVAHVGIVGSLLFWTLESVQPDANWITAAASDAEDALFEAVVDIQPLAFQNDSSQESLSEKLESELPQQGAWNVLVSDMQSTLLDSMGGNWKAAIEEQTSLGLSKAIAGGSGSPGQTTGTQFFGVQAVGNTFVYLVDSSGSMRRDGAFDAAKSELIRSLSSLKPSQRFFVIFFSDTLEIMSLDGREPENYPVYATQENLRSVHDWVSRIEIRGGRSPNDAFDFAITMDPDAIFLLFDGETRTDVAGHLRKVNRVTDVISGTVPRVSIHTIGFYSQEHEAALRTIAAENKGAYRFIPKPTKPNSRK